MRTIIIILLAAAVSLAQEIRQIYGTGGSVVGTASTTTVRNLGVAGQAITGTASGDDVSNRSGYAEFLQSAGILLDAPIGPRPLPEAFAFPQNYPNPFNPATTLTFALPQEVHVSLDIYDILGRRAATLIDQTIPAGEYKYVFQAPGGLASGLYFAVLAAGEYRQVRKLMLLK